MAREVDEWLSRDGRRRVWLGRIGTVLAWAFLAVLALGGLMTFGII